MNKIFNEYSITINGDTATVTGDIQKSHQLEMLWTAIGELGTAMNMSDKQYAVKDWVDNDKGALIMFAIQQQDLHHIVKQIASESLVGKLSNESIGQLGTYSTYQLAVIMLFGIDKSDIAQGINYLIDEQRKNNNLTLELKHSNEFNIQYHESELPSEGEVVH